MNRARLKNLEKLEAEAGKRPPSLEAVMEAFILPVVKLGQDPAQGGPTVMRLLGLSLFLLGLLLVREGLLLIVPG